MQYIPKPFTSKMQMQMSAKISKMGFIVDDEVEFAPYTVDMVLPEPHVGIECDGHFSHKSRKSKDPQRDAFLLEKYGLPILRFVKVSQCNTQKVMDFINRWECDVEERKQRNLDARMNNV